MDSLKEQKHPALDIAVEVVYYPVFDERPHEGMMGRKVASTIQDYRKLIALMEFTYPNGTPFCKEAAMMFFSNTGYTDEIIKMLDTLKKDTKVSFLSVIQSAYRT